ncbi:MAG: transcriptional repressor LexA [Thermodesulfobacteriota bacterium]
MKPDLTARQQLVLDYFTRHMARRGKPPSLRQAAQDLNVSHAAVAQTIKALESKGRLLREGPYSRSMVLLDSPGPGGPMPLGREVPVVGAIRAGLPMYAQQEWDGAVTLDAALFTGDNLFALRVTGDSMSGAGILDGDIAVCEPRQYARNGEIVAALIRGEEATVKRFFLRADHIELKAENPDYPPLVLSFDEVLVQGRVVGIIRGPSVMEKV